MNQLQTKMFNLLCEIDEICRKHGIEYCLFAGSGLGADRHGGFIPWDDDADIIMTLDNYEKFMSVFDAEAKPGRVLNCLEKNYDYPFTYARYVDVTTTAIQRHTAFGGCDPGIKIDIFVVVPTHSDLAKAEKHRMKILAFSEVINPYAVMHTHRPEGYAAFYQAEKKLYDKWGREKYIRKRMPKLKYYKKKGSGRYVLFSGMLCNSYLLDSKIMDEVHYVKFENTELPISKYNDEFSKILYGEGWISKPANVEQPHHTFLLDMNRPYQDYLDMLWEKYDFTAAERTAANRSDMHIYERDQFKDVMVNSQQLRNLAVEINTNALCEKLTGAEKTDWKSLYGLFADYYSMQLRRINKTYRLFIGLRQETFESAINAAVMCDRYYEAADIITVGLESGSLSTGDERLRRLQYRVNSCREITKALYIDRDFERLQAIIGGITDEQVRASLTVKIAELWLKAAEAEVSETDGICELVDACVSMYGTAGELLAIKGYCYEKAGFAAEAAAVYEQAAANVRNGYLYQWLADKGYSTYEYAYE